MEAALLGKGHYSGTWKKDIATYWLFFQATGTVRVGGITYQIQSGDVLLQKAGDSAVYDLDCTGMIGRLSLPLEALKYDHVYQTNSCTEAIRKTFFFFLDLEALGQAETTNSSAIEKLKSQLFFNMMCDAGVASGKMNPAIPAFIKDINLNLSDPDYDPQKTITTLGYSVGYFRQIFKQSTGVSPHRFLSTRRLENAKLEMERAAGAVQVQEIAAHNGFSDPFAFAKQFKAHFGCSPSEYMKKAK